MSYPGTVTVTLLTSERSQIFALILMLLAVAFGYYKGRNAAIWTQIPLIAFAITSIGPSVFAAILYLTYTSGLIQPNAAGYHFFPEYVFAFAIDFALINWAFVLLYLVCRIWPNVGGTQLAMWFSMVAMSLPNVILFSLAPLMISNDFKAPQAIGIIEATVSLPIITIIWPGKYLSLINAGFGVGLITSALMAPVPLFGLTGWLVGHLVGWFVSATHLYPKKNC